MIDRMPAPSRAYLASPEVCRSRLTARAGSVLAVVENFSNVARPFGLSEIQLSLNDGQTFDVLGWSVHWASFLRKFGRQWPPHDIETMTVDDRYLAITYCEATYDGPVDRAASLDLATGRWRLA